MGTTPGSVIEKQCIKCGKSFAAAKGGSAKVCSRCKVNYHSDYPKWMRH